VKHVAAVAGSSLSQFVYVDVFDLRAEKFLIDYVNPLSSRFYRGSPSWKNVGSCKVIRDNDKALKV
jgi:hypothetical protein